MRKCERDELKWNIVLFFIPLMKYYFERMKAVVTVSIENTLMYSG